MKNIAVFYGGKSVEHDISIITALQAMSNKINGCSFIPVYILPNGNMVSGDNLTEATTYLNFEKNVKNQCEVLLRSGSGKLSFMKKNKIKKEIKIDCALLCNHGHGGEDGSLQGLLELAEIPYTSCNVSSSANCMDKSLTKICLSACDILSPAYLHISKCEFVNTKDKFIDVVKEKIGFPCIIKPVSLGSSVGISVCEEESLLINMIEQAFLYDDKIIIERFLMGAREFCCAVVKNSNSLITSKIVEVDKGKFYTFEEKYLNEKKNVEKKISSQLKKVIEEMAVASYKALDCHGVVRVDFLYDEEGKELYVNELNSIPGSLAFNLFDTSFSDLIVCLVEQAEKRFEEKNNIVYKFNSKAIENYINFSENLKFK